jgi:hypothetical protein
MDLVEFMLVGTHYLTNVNQYGIKEKNSTSINTQKNQERKEGSSNRIGVGASIGGNGKVDISGKEEKASNSGSGDKLENEFSFSQSCSNSDSDSCITTSTNGIVTK